MFLISMLLQLWWDLRLQSLDSVWMRALTRTRGLGQGTQGRKACQRSKLSVQFLSIDRRATTSLISNGRGLTKSERLLTGSHWLILSQIRPGLILSCSPNREAVRDSLARTRATSCTYNLKSVSYVTKSNCFFNEKRVTMQPHQHRVSKTLRILPSVLNWLKAMRGTWMISLR